MNARAERHSGIDDDSEAAFGRRIVTPFGDEEEALTDFDRLQQIARRLHPIALFFLAKREPGNIFSRAVRLTASSKNERTAPGVKLDDARRALLPQFGNQQVAVFADRNRFRERTCRNPSP